MHPVVVLGRHLPLLRLGIPSSQYPVWLRENHRLWGPMQTRPGILDHFALHTTRETDSARKLLERNRLKYSIKFCTQTHYHRYVRKGPCDKSQVRGPIQRV